MSEKTIGAEALIKAALALFDEGYVGPQGKGTWFTDNEPGSGLLGAVERLDASAASRPLTPGDPLTAASHVGHLRFSLELANRAAKGENPYPTANWAKSWELRSVDAEEWKKLVAALRSEIAGFREVLASGKAFEDEEFATGALGLICHGAWHLGALKQGLGLISAPRE
jgi:hypothetical protein